MSWKEKIRNPFVQQYAVEILFPLIGFFFFDWSLVVIAVFYLMDQVGSESAFFRRLIRVSVQKNAPVIRIFSWSLAGFLVLFAIQCSYLLGPGFDHVSRTGAGPEIYEFMIEEGWFLFPLVVFMYHFKDQFLFYMPRRYLAYDPIKMQRYRLLANLAVLLLVIGGFAVLQIVKVPDAAILVSFLLIKIGFDFSFAKWVDRKSRI